MTEKLDIYTKGTQAWFRDEEEGYVLGMLVDKEITDKSIKLTFTNSQSGQDLVFEQTMDALMKTNFDSLPPIKNPENMELVDDLTTLSYLHEPAVLHTIKKRYQQELIYTYSGLVLIAMNPFRKMNIYTPEIMKQYCGRPRHELDPHVFAIAEEAYRRMVNEKINQSIIVSGESGAGKTQSAKLIMRYIAVVEDLNSSVNDADLTNGSTSVEDAVLSTNPIMEAFGNAKTTRNDNSSRFGKYIEILFDKNPNKGGLTISGAHMRTYLLERSRLIFQPESERNYHIFYQLCAGAPAAEREQLGLGKWDEFFYLRQGKTGNIKGVDDAEELLITQKSLSTVGISVASQWQMFQVCAALLHLGNVDIFETNGVADLDEEAVPMQMASNLLGVTPAIFKKWLTKKQITTRSEKILSNASVLEATSARDSVAKFIYSMLFEWIVRIVNSKLDPTQASEKSDVRFIGVLDIYGFEHFQKNSFEQFCINFANEKLQQEFTRHVFRLEQEEYVAENISWSFIDFNDNQPCIDMIEGKLGILDLLDEESRMPSGKDKSLIAKYYQRFGTADFKFFAKPKFGEAEFVIKHYALDVSYQIEGFIDKNKDTVSEELLDMLNNTNFAFLKEVISIELELNLNKSGLLVQDSTGSIDSTQLDERKPTVIRKSNNFKESFGIPLSRQNSDSNLSIESATSDELKKSLTIKKYDHLLSNDLSPTRKGTMAKGAPKKPTLGAIFKASLIKLMETLRQTNPHYIRCIKPNQAKVAFELEAPNVLSQLIACGVLETIKISRAGYPNKKSFAEFVDRFYFLVPSIHWRSDPKELTEIICKTNIKGLDKYQIGKSKIFFRASQLAYLEMIRKERFEKVAILFQKNIKRAYYQKRYKEYKEAAIVIQNAWNRYCIQLQKRIAATLCFQKHWKARKQYAAIVLQLAWTSYCKKKIQLEKSRGYSATKIASVWKMIRAKREYESTRRKVIKLQSLTRGRQVRKNYKELKSKTTISKELHYQLEPTVILLSQELSDKKKENAALLKTSQAAEDQLSNLKEKYFSARSELRRQSIQSQSEFENLREKLAELQEMNATLSSEIQKQQVELKKRDDQISLLQSQLQKNLATSPASPKDPKFETLKAENAFLKAQMSRLAIKLRGGITEDFIDSAHKLSIALGETEFYDGKTNRIQSVDEDLRQTGPQDRLIRMLGATELQDEIIDALIVKLIIPLPTKQALALKRDIVFPAHLIGYILSFAVKKKVYDKVRETVRNVHKSINEIDLEIQQTIVRTNEDSVHGFWFSNTHEILNILRSIRRALPRPSLSNQLDDQSPIAIIAEAQDDFQNLMTDIHRHWLFEIRRKLSDLIVPGIIEYQSLPEYSTKTTQSWTSSWLNSAPVVTTEDVLQFLRSVTKTMKYYYVEDSISKQILSELIFVIGTASLNHLLMRKNFCNWKRGIQIERNISRLEEWCNGVDISEATLHLQPLLQATKLMIKTKSSKLDLESINEECFLLNQAQIKKLLMLYSPTEFESPIQSELIESIPTSSQDSLLASVEFKADLSTTPMTFVDNVENYVPSWVEMPILKAILSAALD